MTFSAAIALLSLAVFPTTLAFGQSPVTLPDAPAGTLIVTGRVASVEARWETASRTIHSYVALDVAQVLLGTDVPTRLVLDQLGGETGGIGLWLPDQAVFRAGEDVLVVLTAADGTGTLHTVGLGRGKMPISVAEAERLLAQAPRRALPAFVAVPAAVAAVPRPAPPAYVFLPTGGEPARWHEVDDHVAVFVDHSAVPVAWSGGSPAKVADAITLWRNSGMDLDLRDGGATFTGGCSAAFTGNGRIAVSYNDPCGGVADWVIGGGYYTTGDLRTVHGVTFQKFIQGFVVLDDVGPQTSSAGCFQDAVTHGLGHALGLGHTAAAGSMMEPNPRGNCSSGPASLGADDRAGITAIYQGIASGPFPPDTPVGFTVNAVLSTVSLEWTPAATGGPAQRYIVEAGTAPGTYNLGALTFPVSPTSTAVSNVPPGTYHLRISARNALGTSPPSAERSVTVGACTAPGPPGMLSGTSLDTQVSVQWSAPASGVAQGYRLLVGTAPGLSSLGATDVPPSVTSLAATAPYGTYFVRVQATNVCGVSAPSNEVTLAVQPCTTAPQAPTGLTFTKAGTHLTLSWTAPTGTPPTSYTIVAGRQPGASDIAVLSTGNALTSIGASVAAGTYHIRVLARNACGVSGASNEILVALP